MSEKEVVANVVAAPAVVETAPKAEGEKEVKYVDPRVGYVPMSKHARKALAARRAKNKNAKKARKINRGK